MVLKSELSACRRLARVPVLNTRQHMGVSMFNEFSYLIFNVHGMGIVMRSFQCTLHSRMVYFSLLSFDFKFIAVSCAMCDVRCAMCVAHALYTVWNSVGAPQNPNWKINSGHSTERSKENVQILLEDFVFLFHFKNFTSFAVPYVPFDDIQGLFFLDVC